MSNPTDYTVGWVCALSKEFTAAKTMLDENHPPCSIPNRDTNQYALGKIGDHNVVIAVLPEGEYGLSSAANVATNMLNAFPNIRIGLLVGIGGGAPTSRKDIRLGDVVVSSAGQGTGGIFQYDFGRSVQEMEFQTTGFLNQAPTALRTAISALKTEHEMKGHRIQETISQGLERYPKLKKKYSRPPKSHDRLYLSTSVHPFEDRRACIDACGEGNVAEAKLVKRVERSDGDDDPEIHYGIIASANQLMKDATIRDKLSSERDIICFEMEAAGLVNNFPCIVIRGVCDYADTHKNDEWQEYAAMTAAAYAKELLSQVLVTRIEEERRINEVLGHLSSTISKMNSSIEGQGEILHVINNRAESDQYREVVGKLPYVKEAAFDSHSEEHNPTCLENTRVDLLTQIWQWVEDEGSRTVFWLNGMAGTGKSTISRTVAQVLSRQGILGASFFFKRGYADQGSAAKFCTTIARQLALNQRHFGTFLQDAIRKDPDIGNRGLKVQFEKLIMEPLAAAKHQSASNSNIAIIVDALDECDPEQDVRLLISLFSELGKLRNIKLRALLTSRPELPIRLGFHSVTGTFQDLILHQIPRPVIEHDISVFFRHEIQKIVLEWNSSVAENRRLPVNWPGEDNLRLLIERAIPLFIFAATMCRFISDGNSSPKTRLKQIIGPASWTVGDQMQATYAPVLDQLLIGLSPKGRTDAIREFKTIVGAIVLLETPLPVDVLSRLIDVDQDRIQDRLDKLHSVLDIPKSPEVPIHLFHLSFKEYLINEGGYPGNEFMIDCRETSRRLLEVCLRVMTAHLKTDICDLRHPGTARNDINRDLIDSCLPPELRYACVYWIKHQEVAVTKPTDTGLIKEFLKIHLLHWIEALILLNRSREISGLLKRLRLVCRSDVPLTDFLEDAGRFLNLSITTVAMYPLQLYSHALIFAPENSLVKLNFKSAIPRWIKSVSDMTMDWDSCLGTFPHPGGRITFVPDTTQLFLGYFSQAFSILDWDTEEHFVERFATSSGPMQISHGSPVLSPDGKVVAVPTSRGLVEIRKLQGGTIGFELPADCDVWSELCFSPNSKVLVVSTTKAWQIWDLAACKSLYRLPRGIANQWCNLRRGIRFSADSMLLLASECFNAEDGSRPCYYHMLRIWNCLTGECLFQLIISSTFDPIFTPDSKSFVFMSAAHDVEVWSTTTYSRIYGFSIPYLNRPNGTLRISPDSKLLLVPFSALESFQILSLAVDQPFCRSYICQNPPTFSYFTPDSKHVMVGDVTGGILVWSPYTESKFSMPIGHGNNIDAIDFSLDGKVLVTMSSRRSCFQLWDWEKEFTSSQCKHELATKVHTISRVVLSPDLAKLAVICSDVTQIYAITPGRLDRLFEITGNDDCVARFSSDSRYCFFYDHDNHSSVLDAYTGVCLWESYAENKRFEFSSSDDSNWLAATMTPINIMRPANARVLVSKRVGDTFELQHTLETSDCYRLVGARFSPDAKLVAALDEQSHIAFVWNLQRPLDEPYVIERCSSIAAFSNSFLAVEESGTRQINIWHIARRLCHRTLELSAECYAFSPSEQLLAVGDGSVVRVLDWRTGVRLVEVYGACIPQRILEPEPIIWFLPGDAGIKTPLGIFRISKKIFAPPCPPSSPKVIRHTPLFHVHHNSEWVQWQGNKLLKLPKEHDPDNVLVSNTQIVIILASRKLVVVSFRESELCGALLD